MNTNLTSEEISYLIDLLEKEINETKTEIYHSNNYDFKESLKARLRLIQNLRNKLNIPVSAG